MCSCTHTIQPPKVPPLHCLDAFFVSWYFFYEIFGVLVRLFFVSFVFDAVAHSILFIFFVVLLLVAAFHEIRVCGI